MSHHSATRVADVLLVPTS
uniref:Uncharacterized protein n=1 Tax=Arundo donax TaxID=35708 RepID=A0A0A8YI88_ARUDO